MFGATCIIFEPEPFPRLPGPAVGPKGPKIGQKPGAGIIISPCIRSTQCKLAPDLDSSPAGPLQNLVWTEVRSIAVIKPAVALLGRNFTRKLKYKL